MKEVRRCIIYFGYDYNNSSSKKQQEANIALNFIRKRFESQQISYIFVSQQLAFVCRYYYITKHLLKLSCLFILFSISRDNSFEHACDCFFYYAVEEKKFLKAVLIHSTADDL